MGGLKVGDKIRLLFSEECPDAVGREGRITNLDGDGYFDVAIPSVLYGDTTYVKPNTDIFKVITAEGDSTSKGLAVMPKVGDQVRYLGGLEQYLTGMRVGEKYKVDSITPNGKAVLITDDGLSWTIHDSEDFRYFELISEDSSDILGLLVNLGRRLHEVETSQEEQGRQISHHRHNAVLDFEFIYEEIAGLKGEPNDSDEKEAPPTDAVNPGHYKRGKFETIEVIEEITQGYDDGFVAHCAGTAIKYIARAPYKHATPTEDLRKAVKYLEFAIERLETETSA